MSVMNLTCLGTRGAVLTAVAVLTMASGFSGRAEAQGADKPADSGEIAEVLVTAQRREESLQKVPLSIVAIGSEELRRANVTEASRLEQIAPGLRLGRSGADPRPAIRGIYTESIQGNADPRVGFYIDEIYQSRTSQTSVPFVDLERVEVQKGPQGTLYGRNSYVGSKAAPNSCTAHTTARSPTPMSIYRSVKGWPRASPAMLSAGTGSSRA